MRKALIGGAAAVLLAGGAYAFAPAAASQVQPAPAPAPDARVLMLDGRGSTIGVRITDAEKEGVRVEEVTEGSPAQKAGIRPGDIVVEFDGERVRSARQLSRLVQETPEGRTVRATVLRGGSRQTLEVTPDSGTHARGEVLLHMPDIGRHIERGLRALPRGFAFDFDVDPEAGIHIRPRGRLGAQLMPLTEQLAEYFGAKEGVLVSSVDRDSAAAKAGLKAGDVIVAVNGRKVTSAGDIGEEIRGADEGKQVELRVLRDRKEITLKAQVPERRREETRRFVRPA